jgi:cytoskeleton protein RodZ
MNEETNNDIFKSLKEKREALGLTLNDIFQRTRITTVNLEAIENGSFHLLAVPIYARNFIKTYTRTLGIDSAPFLAKYDEYLNSINAVETQRLEQKTEKVSYLDKIVEYKTYLWAAATLSLFLIGLLIVVNTEQPTSDNSNLSGETPAIDVVTTNDPSLTEPALPLSAVDQAASIPQVLPTIPLPAVDQKTVVTPTAPVSPPPVVDKTAVIPRSAANDATKTKAIPAKSDTARQEVDKALPDKSPTQKPRALAVNNDESTLIINATEETWLRIKTDQNPSYQVLLKAGEKIVRKATSVELDIGNAGGISIEFKGKKMENMGKTGEVTHLQLP